MKRVVVLVAALAGLVSAAAAQPRISLTQEVVDGENGITTVGGSRSVAVSTPDGAFVYVVAAASDGDQALTVFSRDMATGHLSLVEAELEGVGGVSGLEFAQVLGISPDGAHVYAAGSPIAVFSRDAITGELTFEATSGYPDRASGMAFSPGGEHVYLTSDLPNPDAELAVYARDAVTGALTLVQQVVDGQGGVDGLERASSVAVSPDGKHVYATGRFDDALAAFERDPVTGELTFLQKYADGTGGIDGLKRPEVVGVSPDGAQVYTGGGESTLVRFDRDAGTGLLTFVEETTLPRHGTTLAINGDGTRLAMTGTGDPDQVFLLTRDTGTGTVTFASAESFDNTRGSAISPDGTSIYVAASDRVGVFRVVTTGCSATPMLGCLLPTESNKASVQLKDSIDDTRDKLTSKWVKGAAFTIGDFGDPINQPDDVVTCVYDASANPQPVLDALLPGLSTCRGKPCWKTNATGTTLKYKDPDVLPDGILNLTAKASTAGLSSVKVKGKKSALPMPTLPLTAPVRVQVQASTGTCWEAVFSTPIVNDVEQFKAKGD